MIPRLTLQETLKPEYTLFLEALAKTPFSGEMRPDFASRLLMSTDNSIYQILPQAIVFPRSESDLVHLFKLANREQFKNIAFAPRGGGTGTNGQSLSPGIIIDCSKYMNRILEVNLEQAWVRVQPGVVLDQLNADLKPYGVFFAPSVSPSDRATIGGTINTDACGKGSRIYGRTSNHILELNWVLSDGTAARSHSISPATLSDLKQQPGRLGKIYRQVDEIVTSKREIIAQTFPKIPRFMTGYNLAKVYQNDNFNLNWILAGSEGTLAVITEAKLKLTPLPKYKQLLAIHYRCFDDALSAAETLLATEPAAIETIDEKILDLAKQDAIYHHVKDFVGDAKALNLVEFTGETIEEIQHKVSEIKLENGYYLAPNGSEINNLWNLRKKGVGLLGNTKGERKPIPFIEDTAVSPECLASYIREFKALLTEYELDYAMFGHVDVGCLHVRPALDMKAPNDEKLIRELSDKVVSLVRKYGGVMWGEHGKGFRSEYTPIFFGELYEDLRKIKAAFDPDNRLNPGKIVTPFGSDAEVVKIESPLRGHFDRQVPASVREEYAEAFSCNGNGACFNFNPDSVMCPSYKGTSDTPNGTLRDRIHSPKGRATLLREWWRQIGTVGARHQKNFELVTKLNTAVPLPPAYTGTRQEKNFELAKKHTAAVPLPPVEWEELEKPAIFPIKLWNTLQKYWGVYDYSHEVYQGMHGCLSCKACATQCPIHVDVPHLKSKFLQLYYTRYLRHWRDYFFANIETLASWQSYAPDLFNFITQNPVSHWLIKNLLGLVDPPVLSSFTLKQGLAERQAPKFDLIELSNLSQAQRENSVILLQDAFTSFFESQLVLDTYDLLSQLGYTVYMPPFFASGKPLHVKGFLPQFRTIAQKNFQTITKLGNLGIPVIGIEPSIVLTYRDEYIKILDAKAVFPRVQLLQEFLVTQLERLPKIGARHHQNEGLLPTYLDRRAPTTCESYYLLGHCTEKTIALTSQQQWQQVFGAIGIPLTLVSTGCCGMAGIYGHETEHYAQSKAIYQMSWGRHIPSSPEERQRLLATGFSCRSQVKRFEGFSPNHPVQVLLTCMVNSVVGAGYTRNL
ncbi:MAG TPA: glycerol-3-phosphate dehydrogenase [Cyanobacteria bacterium UBA11369]|nr:glycerol-3-phosphate dehydrogenase [Cyanobacteria bacterium UBA11371]HBE48298.1 glycerol-3-phosphate dehydrogenase [Cyanobacteria bacterium UBA11369]